MSSPAHTTTPAPPSQDGAPPVPDSGLRALGVKASQAPFAHGAEHALPRGITLIDSYHTSRYNQNTGRITEDMFDEVFALAMG